MGIRISGRLYAMAKSSSPTAFLANRILTFDIKNEGLALSGYERNREHYMLRDSDIPNIEPRYPATPKAAAIVSKRQVLATCLGHFPVQAVLAMAASATFLFFLGPPASAAESSDNSAVVCLENIEKTEDGRGRSFAIAIPANKAKEFLSRGFKLSSCPSLQRLDGGNKLGICALASARDPGINLFFWQHFSFTPKEGCEMISTVISSTP